MINLSENWIAQAVGLVASALIITAFAHKTDDKFKYFLVAGALVFSIHYFLMGALIGMLAAILNACRTYCSMRFHKSNSMMLLFISMYVVLTFFAYENYYDLFPIFAGVISTFAMYRLSGIQLRIVAFFAEGAWLLFSILIQSVGGLITNIFVLGTNCITTYRLMQDKKNDQNTSS